MNKIDMSLNDPFADRTERQHRRQIITWYDTHSNFVYIRVKCYLQIV